MSKEKLKGSKYPTEEKLRVEVDTREARRVLQDAIKTGKIAPINPATLRTRSSETGVTVTEAEDLNELDLRRSGGWWTFLRRQTKK